MNGYMISIVGIFMIFLYSLLILLVFYLLGRLLRRWLPRWRWVLLTLLSPLVLALLSLPWLEEAWISWHFNKACEDAGVKVYRQVEVEGFYNETGGIYSFIKGGFKFMEEKTSKGKILHVERPIDMETPMDQWKVTVMEHPTTRYHLVYAYRKGKYQIEEPIGWKLHKLERRVIDSQTGEILGRNTTIIRVFPFHEALLASLLGPPIVLCPGPDVKPYFPQSPFLESILKPVSTQ